MQKLKYVWLPETILQNEMWNYLCQYCTIIHLKNYLTSSITTTSQYICKVHCKQPQYKTWHSIAAVSWVINNKYKYRGIHVYNVYTICDMHAVLLCFVLLLISFVLRRFISVYVYIIHDSSISVETVLSLSHEYLRAREIALGLYSLSGRTSYCKISCNLEAERFGMLPTNQLPALKNHF